jgi:hypothetical protein
MDVADKANSADAIPSANGFLAKANGLLFMFDSPPLSLQVYFVFVIGCVDQLL